MSFSFSSPGSGTFPFPPRRGESSFPFRALAGFPRAQSEEESQVFRKAFPVTTSLWAICHRAQYIFQATLLVILILEIPPRPPKYS